MQRNSSRDRVRHRLPAVLEYLESRALLSAVLPFFHGGMEGHGGTHMHAPDFTTTPITDLTGSAVTFSQIVALPAVQVPGALKFLPAVQRFLPAVQDVATITSASMPVHLRGYSVSIDWGDGSSPTRGLLVVDHAGLIHVKGAHAYTTIGTFSVTVTVTQHLSASQNTTGAPDPTLTITSTANVTQNSDTGVTVNATTGESFTGTVGSFDTTASTDPTAFTAIISWGDHHRSLGTVTLNSDGTFAVAGTHTYATAGTYRIAILIYQHQNPTTTANTSDDVHDGGGDAGWHLGWRKHGFFTTIFSTAMVEYAHHERLTDSTYPHPA